MFGLITDPKEAEPIMLEMFHLFAKSINKIVSQISGTEYLKELQLLDDCKLLLKKVEQIIKDHPKMISSEKVLTAYNNVIMFKSNYFSLVSQLSTNIAEEVKILLQKRLSSLKSTYGSRNAEPSPIDLRELEARMEKDQLISIVQSDTESCHLFFRGLSQNLREYFKEQVERFATTVAGIDLILSHFGQVTNLLHLTSLDSMYSPLYKLEKMENCLSVTRTSGPKLRRRHPTESQNSILTMT